MRRRELLAGLGVAVWAAVGGLLAAHHASPGPSTSPRSPGSYLPKDYDDVRQRWTRHGKLVRDIGTVLEFWATYKSWDFRQAYIENYAEVYSLPESERRALRQAQLEAARTSYEFHVVAQSTEYEWNNLHEDDTVWKIALADGAGRELAPASVTLEKLPSLYEMRFFPNRTDFSRTYTMKFPRGAGEADRRFSGPSSGLLLLKVLGPLGKVETSWQGAPVGPSGGDSSGRSCLAAAPAFAGVRVQVVEALGRLAAGTGRIRGRRSRPRGH